MRAQFDASPRTAREGKRLAGMLQAVIEHMPKLTYGCRVSRRKAWNVLRCRCRDRCDGALSPFRRLGCPDPEVTIGPYVIAFDGRGTGAGRSS
jgi:hypothetical protein